MRYRPGRFLPALLTALLLAMFAAVSAATAPSAGAATDRTPVGYLDSMRNVRSGVEVTGWDADYDSPTTPLRTYATVDHHGFWTQQSDLLRPDVARVHPTLGARHGFDYTVPVPPGQHLVCVSAINLGKYSGRTLSCQSRLFGHNPYGYLDSVSQAPGALRVVGWAFDPDDYTAALPVSVTVDGVARSTVANAFRPDVEQVHPGDGAVHGFDATLPVTQGAHTVCVTAGNVGLGSDTWFGCRTVTLDNDPVGYLDKAERYGAQLLVAGWAADRDNPVQPVTARITVDGVVHSVLANQRRDDVARVFGDLGAEHGYAALYPVTEGTHQVCVAYVNIGYGTDFRPACRTAVVTLTPTVYLNPPVATSTGATVSGWAADPDTPAAALPVRFTVDGAPATTVTANHSAATHTGHAFSAALLPRSGTHTICAVAANAGYGTHDSAPSCRSITLALSPIGYFDSAVRVPNSTDIAVTGWGIDPDTSSALTIGVTVDGVARPNLVAGVARPDVEQAHPGWGADHGYSAHVTATDGEHLVCVTARNVNAGADHPEGCRRVWAVHPVAPGAPQSVTASAGYGSIAVHWTAPATDGGAPRTKYVITVNPGAHVLNATATASSATVTGLAVRTTYTASVQAVNVAGASAAHVSAAVTTIAGPPAQTTPAPVSTSRYIRNVYAATSTDLARMRAEGAADAAANPTGHAYLVLLDIGGQDQYDHGVVLSATTHFVSYANLVRDVDAYADGYHSAQKPGAPVTIAVGTNNDMDVSYSSGQAWADSVIDPIAAHAAPYAASMSVAGANDIEPGFRGSYTASRSWLSGYLASTTHRFVFNGSADGCSWYATGGSCNNGWSMAGLYTLAGGAAPTRVVNLPQVYNTTMAGQWKYISLTGVVGGHPRINFGGTLTEWTACDQSNCGSISGHTAWSTMWNDLQSDSRLRIGSLPYSTDLRIDR